MVDGPKKCPTTPCGMNGVPCGDAECYPVCEDLTAGEDNWALSTFVMINDGTGDSDIHLLTGQEIAEQEKGKAGRPLSSVYRLPKASDINSLAHQKEPWNRGFAGICRSRSTSRFFLSQYKAEKYFKKGETGYWWALRGDEISHLVFRNKYNITKHGHMNMTSIELSATEMKALAECRDLGLTDIDVAVAKRPRPKEGEKGSYRFTGKSERLEQIIYRLYMFLSVRSYLLANGWTLDRLNWLLGELLRIKEKADEPTTIMKEQLEINRVGIAANKEAIERNAEIANRSIWKSVLGNAAVLATIFGALYLLQKRDMRKMNAEAMERMEKMNEKNIKMMMGEQEVKIEDLTTDMVEEQRKLLEENRQLNEIEGVDKEALEVLDAYSRPEYANPLEVGPFGAGKDKVFERAAQLIALEDPRVHESMRGRRLLKADITDLQRKTQLRGSASDRNKVLIDAMMEGRDLIYFPELHRVLSAGSAAEVESAESIGAALEPVLTNSKAHWGGSTTPEGYRELARRWGAFMRRLVVLEKRPDPASKILEIVRRKYVPWYAEHYGVEISSEAINASVRLGLIYMDEVHSDLGYSSKLGPWAAVREALLRGIQFAVRHEELNGKKLVITADHIVRGLERTLRIKVDPLAVWEDGVERMGPEGGVSVFKSEGDTPEGTIEAVRAEEALESKQLAAAIKQVRDLVKGVSPAERVRLAEDLLRTWESLSDNERVRITQEGIRMGGGEGPMPEHWIKETLARSAEGLAEVRGVKGGSRDPERPEDRDRKIREGAERKGEGMLDHALDPRKPKPVK